MQYRTQDGYIIVEANAFGNSFYEGSWREATKEEVFAWRKSQEKVLALSELKSKLAQTDYQSLKANEGVPCEDWENIKAERESIRKQIREIENAS